MVTLEKRQILTLHEGYAQRVFTLSISEGFFDRKCRSISPDGIQEDKRDSLKRLISMNAFQNAEESHFSCIGDFRAEWSPIQLISAP